MPNLPAPTAARDTASRCQDCAMPADACARRYDRTRGVECCDRCSHPEDAPIRGAVLRQTLYALTRTVGDMDHGTMVELCTRDGHPLPSGAFPVQDGISRVAYVTAADVALVSGTVVLADHVAGWSTAFGGFGSEGQARTFAVALLGIGSPAVAGVWTGEVIRQQ